MFPEAKAFNANFIDRIINLPNAVSKKHTSRESFSASVSNVPVMMLSIFREADSYFTQVIWNSIVYSNACSG